MRIVGFGRGSANFNWCHLKMANWPIRHHLSGREDHRVGASERLLLESVVSRGLKCRRQEGVVK